MASSTGSGNHGGSRIRAATGILIAILRLSGVFAGNNVRCDIHLTICSLQDMAGHIELNWNPHCPDLPEKISLYDMDPNTVLQATPLISIEPQNFLNGFFLTTTKLESPKLPGGWDKMLIGSVQPAVPGPHCLPFWIASSKEGKLQEVNCLKIQPTWMADLRGKIDKIPLSKMLVPGTHDSGSFRGPDSLVQGNALARFVMTQDQDIWNQLVFGIRYFDLRVAYYMDSDYDEENTSTLNGGIIHESRFWINHDQIKVRSLLPVLRSIKRFVEIATGEIVIVDIHRLPVGFYLLNGVIRNERHEELINLLFQELGDLAIDFNAVSKQTFRFNIHLMNGPRMTDLWESGKRIIICYPETAAINGALWLWPSLKQLWGNKQDPKDLKKYIETALARDPPTKPQGNQLWAIMAQMTPAADFLFFMNPENNLRKMADDINRNLTRWVRDDWWSRANIITSDFFLGNDLIDVSVNVAHLKAAQFNVNS